MTAKIGTIAGVLLFVGSGLTTVLTGITNFGAEGSALDVARRNHTWWLVAAAALAASGLFLGATYAILKEALKDSRPAQVAAPFVLIGAVLVVSSGVVMGVAATVKREPGRPAISLERTGEMRLRVKVTADGLASSVSYEARVEGWNQNGPIPKTAMLVATLLTGKFSPRQNGTLDWQHEVDISPPTEGKTINYVQVIVAKDAEEANTCIVQTGSKQTKAPTCLYTRVPPSVVSQR